MNDPPKHRVPVPLSGAARGGILGCGAMVMGAIAAVLVFSAFMVMANAASDNVAARYWVVLIVAAAIILLATTAGSTLGSPRLNRTFRWVAVILLVAGSVIAFVSETLGEYLYVLLFASVGWMLIALTEGLMKDSTQLVSRRYWRERRLDGGECPFCGYSIHGLPEPRCPECGGSWSWNRSSTRPGRGVPSSSAERAELPASNDAGSDP